MGDAPAFDRPVFGYADISTSDRDEMKIGLMEVRETYDAFMEDDLLPAQDYYADILDTNRDWDDLTPEERARLVGEFRTRPCIGDPTDEANELIDTDEILYVYVDQGSCEDAAWQQSLTPIADNFCFRYESQKLGMLASDIPPYSHDFSKWVVVRKYAQLGCTDVNVQDLTHCLVIPFGTLTQSSSF
ncbi:conserved hypothetical protein [Mesorhizobium plurifarium]|uniref:Cytokinin glycosidase domain-containing protein n=1 Tax=Mesorhizobium plurifarium TaxID=69974 RepID=A0A090DV51_MESPL|nr:conserved hypothetical protein [Mesorhizobium plurifarium]